MLLRTAGVTVGVDSDTHRTTNDTSLDKAYWIHRAAEVCHRISVCLSVHVLFKLVHCTAVNATTTI